MVYKLKPTDPFLVYKGEKAFSYFTDDFYGKYAYKAFTSKGSPDEREAAMEEFIMVYHQ